MEDSRSCIEDSFPNEKRHKEAFEVPCVCFNMLPEAFRQYSEKVTFWPSVTLKHGYFNYFELLKSRIRTIHKSVWM